MSEFTLITHPEFLKLDSSFEKILIKDWFKKDSVEDLNYKFIDWEIKKKEKIDQDTSYINETYETILKEVVEKLNEIHKTNFKKNYWRIIVGSYLRFMSHVIFDRWQKIETVQKNFKIKETYSKKYIKSSLPFDDTYTFKLISQHNHDFNHFIFSKILKNCSGIKILETGTELDFKSLLFNKNKLTPKKVKKISFFVKLIRHFYPFNINKIKILFVKIIKRFSTFFTLNYFRFFPSFLKDFNIPFIFLDNRSVPFDKQILYYVTHKQFPWNFSAIMSYALNVKSVKEPNLELRKKIISDLNLKKTSSFEKLLCDMIWTFMPITFLECYKSLSLKAKENVYSFKTNNIIMRSSDYLYDFQRVLLAKKINEGSSLIIHEWKTGSYCFKNSPYILEDRKISSKFITSGWKDSSDKNLLPLGHFSFSKNMNRNMGNGKKNLNQKESCLITQGALGEYNMEYNHQVETRKSSMEDLYVFYENLNNDIKSKTIIRPKPSGGLSQSIGSDYANVVVNLWKKNSSNAVIDYKTDFPLLLNNARVCVVTWPNCSIYITTLSLNIPTIIFFTKNDFSFTKSFEADFERLKEVGIFHTSTLSAATKINSIWENVDEWWGNEKLQKVRKKFCEENHIYPKKYGSFLKEISDKKKSN